MDLRTELRMFRMIRSMALVLVVLFARTFMMDGIGVKRLERASRIAWIWPQHHFPAFSGTYVHDDAR